MSVGILVAATVALALIPPALAQRLGRRAHPDRLVMLGMLHLLGLVLVPLAVVASVLQLVAHDGHRSLVADAIGLSVVAAIAVRGATASLRARRTWRSVTVALSAAGVPGPRDSTVVGLDVPTAFTAGRRVVVSSTLVGLLAPLELDAVIAHEQAHVTGQHGRIAALASTLTAAAWNSPPARQSLRDIREGLELLADNHALAEFPDPAPITSAVTKMSELGDPKTWSAADGSFLVRRLGCLTAPPSVNNPTNTTLDILAALVGAGIIVTVCGALHVHLAAIGALVCLIAGGSLWYVLRPLRLLR